MRKILVFPIVAALAAGNLAGCARSPGAPDITAIDLGAAVTSFARTLCGVEPVASTISSILIALALPSATPIQAQAKLIADQICEQVNAVRAKRRSVATVVTPEGPAVSYGPKLINGKVVEILVSR